MILRGEIWSADLGEPRGSAPGRHRPVAIVQADAYNESRLQTVGGVVLTTNRRLAASPGNVFVAAEVSGLSDDSIVNVTQIVTIDRRDLESRAGVLPGWIMDEVDAGLRTVLALR